jgi:carboxypeptidase C (cathepsin A)
MFGRFIADHNGRHYNSFGVIVKASVFIFALCAILGSGLTALADDNASSSKPAPIPVPTSKDTMTHASVSIGGRQIPYTATAGTIVLVDAKSKPTCSMFYTAFTADGNVDLSRRPVTFFYNGGPGSSSVWLRMGSFAPKRVLSTEAQHTPPAPYRLVDNGYSLLDKSDLVFVDAPGTGFSRLVGVSKPEDFYGVDQDARAFKQFVEHYVSKNKRWNSPKFLFGESYGTTRSAVLVNMLQQDGMDFNGVVLLSSALNFATFFGGDGMDTEYIGYLPTEAAIAWYHDKIPNKPPDLGAFLRDVRQFALGDYARALLQGNALSEPERTAIARKLSTYTGISEQFYLHADLRVEPGEFEKELLRDQYRITGRLDGRFLGIDGKAIGDSPDYDPADTAFASAYVSAFNMYVRDDLKYQTDLFYKPTNYGEISPAWDQHHSIDGNQLPWPDVVQDLHDAMTQNPELHVFSANGYFDMATPFFATEYTLDHMALDPSLRGHISYGFYGSGHMVYLHAAALAQFKSDLARWYDSVLHS